MTSLVIHFILLWLSSLSLLSLGGISQIYIVLFLLVLLIVNTKFNLQSYIVWLLLSYGFVSYLSTTTCFLLTKSGVSDVTSWYTYICLLVFSVNALIAYNTNNITLSIDKILVLLSYFCVTFLANLFASTYIQYNDTIRILNDVVLSFIFLAIFFWQMRLFPSEGSRHRQLLIPFFLCVFLLTNAHQFLSTKKSIAILRSDWCETDTPYTSKDFTMRTGYSYSLMKELMNSKYSATMINSIDNDIYRYDTVILITPTKPLTNAASKTLLKFVKMGNRLVIISDHTDLYGHARVLNSILGRIGVDFSYDALFGKSGYYKKLELEHTLFNKFRPLTPCSFNTVLPSFLWARAVGWISEKADYSRPNFFGNLTWTSDDKVGNYFVGATLAYGLGQISVWTDSTIFSNFFIFHPKVIDILEILLERGTIPAFLAYLFSFFYIALILARCLNLQVSKNSIYVLLTFLPLSGISYIIWTQPLSFYPKTKILSVYTDRKYITESPINGIPSDQSLSTLYSDLARFGLYPYYAGKTLRQDDNNHLSLFIGTENDFLNVKRRKNLKAIIVNPDNAFVEKVGMKRSSYRDTGNCDIPGFKSSLLWLNRFYVKGDNIDGTCQGKPFMVSNGIISDQQMGSWWRNYPISPVKKYNTKSVCNWIKTGCHIKPFCYPHVETSISKNISWEFRFEGMKTNILHFSVTTNRRYNKFVYIGHGVWGYTNDKNNEMIGGPELYDNVLIDNKRWAAKLIEK